MRRYEDGFPTPSFYVFPNIIKKEIVVGKRGAEEWRHSVFRLSLSSAVKWTLNCSAGEGGCYGLQNLETAMHGTGILIHKRKHAITRLLNDPSKSTPRNLLTIVVIRQASDGQSFQ
jgi:hypothetical protein